MKFKVVTFVAPPHPPTNRASHEGTLWSGPGGRGVPLYTRVIGMCCWMGSHFHDRIDYNGVTFSIALVEWGCTLILLIFGVREFKIYVWQTYQNVCTVGEK